MKTIKRLLLSLAVLGLSMGVMGQGVLTGTVLDQEAGIALPGANIIESGTTNGTITAADGTFTLNTTAQTGSIVISFLGYKSQTLDFDLSNATGVGEASCKDGEVGFGIYSGSWPPIGGGTIPELARVV